MRTATARTMHSKPARQNEDRQPWGWGIRQPPSQVTERRKGGFVQEFVIPFCMATTLATVSLVLLFGIGYASTVRPEIAYLTAIVFCVMHLLWIPAVTLRWEIQVKYLWAGLILTIFAAGLSFAIARVLEAFCGNLPVLAWVIGAGVWLFWLTVAFGIELVLRSPAMEEHGFRELFAFVFQVFLPALMTKEPEPGQAKPLPPPLVRIEWIKDDGNTGSIWQEDGPLPMPRMEALAKHILYRGGDFSEPGCKGVLTQAEYQTARDWMIERRLAHWKNPDNHREGAVIQIGGRKFLEHFIPEMEYEKKSSPAPPYGDDGGSGKPTMNENE